MKQSLPLTEDATLFASEPVQYVELSILADALFSLNGLEEDDTIPIILYRIIPSRHPIQFTFRTIFNKQVSSSEKYHSHLTFSST